MKHIADCAKLMSNIVGRAIALNNEELSQQISTDVLVFAQLEQSARANF